MKIGLTSPYDITWPGGVTVHISRLADQLQAAGHEVKILAPHSPSRELPVGCEVIPLGRSVPVPAGGSVARLSLSLWLDHKVKDVLNREAFDLVHLHEPLMPVLALTVLRHSNAVNVGTFHAVHGKFRNYGWSFPILRRWFKRLDGRIAVSPAAREYVERFFRADYEIIPNGIDVENFSIPKEPIPGLDDGKTNILFVGRMEKRKGFRYLLEAYGKLKWENPNIRLVVVGPGSPDRDCYRIMSERNLQDVVFAGTVSYEDLPRYYQSAHICCAPATGRESFGIVLLEAMASGKPVVATNIKGYAAVVEHGRQGLLAPPKDSGKLAEALGFLINDPKLREQMGAAGRERAAQYSWDLVARQIMGYYDRVMEKAYGLSRPRAV